VRAALRASQPPKYQRAPPGSKLDSFKDEIHRLLKDDCALPGQRIRELIAPLGFVGGKTIVDDYLREVRPFFVTPRTYRTGVGGTWSRIP
jgi:transposase